jgi:hypothetical protein
MKVTAEFWLKRNRTLGNEGEASVIFSTFSDISCRNFCAAAVRLYHGCGLFLSVFHAKNVRRNFVAYLPVTVKVHYAVG